MADNDKFESLLLVLLILVAIFFPITLWSIFKALRAQKWPSVLGKTSSISVKKKNDRWFLLVKYVYHVDDDEREIILESDIEIKDPSRLTENLPSHFFEDYKEKPVHYNPKNPNQACLEPEVSAFDVIITSICGIAFITTVYFIIAEGANFLFIAFIGVVLLLIDAIKDWIIKINEKTKIKKRSPINEPRK